MADVQGNATTSAPAVATPAAGGGNLSNAGGEGSPASSTVVASWRGGNIHRRRDSFVPEEYMPAAYLRRLRAILDTPPDFVQTPPVALYGSDQRS
mmetsp:Transcript_62025/g.166445  ORF Transcript_62025/g.166445 Transcript_62025/m.166445 type:complete len:95 (+) Transcript_62025:491-775(+)